MLSLTTEQFLQKMGYRMLRGGEVVEDPGTNKVEHYPKDPLDVNPLNKVRDMTNEGDPQVHEVSPARKKITPAKAADKIKTPTNDSEKYESKKVVENDEQAHGKVRWSDYMKHSSAVVRFLGRCVEKLANVPGTYTTAAPPMAGGIPTAGVQPAAVPNPGIPSGGSVGMGQNNMAPPTQSSMGMKTSALDRLSATFNKVSAPMGFGTGAIGRQAQGTGVTPAVKPKLPGADPMGNSEPEKL